MTREKLITKLAMELAEWSAGLNKEQLDRLIAPILMPEFADDYHGCVDNWGKAEAYLHVWNITRYDYLAERVRLINKPSWDDAPVWANYLCQQQTGEWWWYANEPKTGDSGWAEWAVWGGGLRLAGRGGRIPAGHNWKDTLEKRPEPMPGPVKSVWNGEGMPPVGTVCEAKVSPGEWLEGEVLAHYSPGADGVELVVFAYQPAPECMRQVGQRAAHCFRPLLSEEDRAVEEMLKDIGIVTGKAERVRKSVCRRLYRARYRKVEDEDMEGGA